MFKFLCKIQYQWSFVLLFVTFGLFLLFEPSLLSGFLFIAASLRICLLRNKVLNFCILLICCSIGLQLFQLQKAKDLQLSFLTEGESRQFQLEINPLNITFSDDYLIGKAKLNQGMEVEINYYHDGEFNVREEIYQKHTIWQVDATVARISTNRNFHLFDYAAYLDNQGVFWELSINQINNIQAKSNNFFIWEEIKLKFLNQFRKFENNSWVATHNKILWNLQSTSYRNHRGQLVDYGVIHFFAISGLHIQFIIQLIRYIMLRLGVTIETSCWLINGILMIYASLVNWPIGVTRAVFMHLSSYLMTPFKLPFSRLDRLAIIGIILLMINPKEILSLSFILSFLMTYVVHFVILSNKNNVQGWKLSLHLTISCILFSWPILIQQNHNWNFGQILFTLIFGLIFEKIIMPLVFLTTIILLLPQNILSLIFLEVIATIHDFFFQFLEHFDLSSITNGVTGHLSDFVVLVLLLLAIVWLTFHWKKAKELIIFALISYHLIFYLRPYFNISTRITILDVNQGDALLYQDSFSKENWLIDTGGRIDFTEGFDSQSIDQTFAEKNILPSLKALGVQELTGVIISHPDIDHMGNLFALAETVAIKHIFISEYTSESPIWKQFILEHPEMISRTIILKQGQQIDLNNMVIFSLYHPSLAYDEDGSNNSSLVTTLAIGPFTFLNIGDLSHEGEMRVIEQLSDLEIDLLKLGHHGSKFSSHSTFIDKINPQLAVISAGENNRYSHPHTEVLELLKQKQIPYLSTHIEGAIQLRYNRLQGLTIHSVYQNK